MTDDTNDAVQGYFDRMNADEFELMAENFTEDATVTVPGAAPAHGRAAIAELYGRMFAPWPEHVDDPVRVVRAGSTVTANVTFTGVLGSGHRMTFDAVDVFDLDEQTGLICRLTNWYDSHAVRREMSAVRESTTSPELEALRDRLNEQGVCAALGLECTRLRSGRASVVMTAEAQVRHRTGAVPGALVAALADVAASFALHTVLPREHLHVTTDLTTHFLEPAVETPLVAEGEVDRVGRRQAFASATVRDAGGRVCATASGTWAVVEDSPDSLARDVP